MVWKDCFGNKLVIGEDVLVAVPDIWGQPDIHSGIVIKLEEDGCYLTYNSFDGDEETEYDIYYHKFHYEDGVIKCIYKLKN